MADGPERVTGRPAMSVREFVSLHADEFGRRRTGDLARARQHLETARQKTASPFDHELLDRRLAQCV
jgi:hypothetical protein